MSKADKKLLIGVVGAAQGLKGEVRLQFFGDDPYLLENYKTLHLKNGDHLTVVKVRIQKTTLIAHFKEISDRTSAEKLRGTELFISREQLADGALDDDEFFISDLIGLAAISENGDAVGEVLSVQNFGADDIIEIMPLDTSENGKNTSYFLPFNRETVPEINFDKKTLTIIAPSEVIAQNDEQSDEGDKPKKKGARRRRPPPKRKATE